VEGKTKLVWTSLLGSAVTYSAALGMAQGRHIGLPVHLSRIFAHLPINIQPFIDIIKSLGYDGCVLNIVLKDCLTYAK